MALEIATNHLKQEEKDVSEVTSNHNAITGAVATLSIFVIFVIVVYFFASVNQIAIQDAVKQNRSSRRSSTGGVSSSGGTAAGSEIRLLIGVFMRPEQYRHRNLLRHVYVTQPPAPAADVTLKFVLCSLTEEEQKVLVALEVMRYDDIIVIRCLKNGKSGKTYAYFSSLPDLVGRESGSGGRFDYVMKANADTYIRVKQLAESLRHLPKKDLYYGITVPCEKNDALEQCICGAGYVVSWDIVEWMRASKIPKIHNEGAEDKVVGEWLEMGERGKNRHSPKPAPYSLASVENDSCSHQFIPNTVAVYGLINQDQWIKTLQYFNATAMLKPSKLYYIPRVVSQSPSFTFCLWRGLKDL